MPLKLIRQDMSRIRCDAIVNSTNEAFLPDGGADAAIHRAAGFRLTELCRATRPPEPGKALATPGFGLPAKYIIHTVGPRWQGGEYGERALLASCYREALRVAADLKCESIAFPLISSGSLGYPKDQVLRVATEEINRFLETQEMIVYIVVYDKASYEISRALFAEVTAFVDDHYVEQMLLQRRQCSIRMKEDETPLELRSLEDALARMDKGFAETLFFYIDQKGLTDVECYKRANVDKKTFSKIKCQKSYKPSKVTAVSFAIALRLTLEETNHLLNTVGMSLSRSSKFDVIIEYFITTGKYRDIFEVNETLYQFDQMTLGV